MEIRELGSGSQPRVAALGHRELSGGPWLAFHALSAKDPGSIPSQGTKIPQTTRHHQEERKKEQVFSIFEDGQKEGSAASRGLLCLPSLLQGTQQRIKGRMAGRAVSSAPTLPTSLPLPPP